MRFLPYLLIALCLLWHTVDTNSLKDEVSDLKARDRVHTEEIMQLRADLDLNTLKIDKVVPGVREILEGKNFLPVWDYRTFLVYDQEKVNEPACTTNQP